MIGRLNIVNYFHIEYPFVTRESDYELVGMLLSRSAELLRDNYNSPLYIVVYPGTDNAPVEKIRKYTHCDITWIDGTRWFERTEDYIIEHDGHPTPLANYTLANKVARFIDDEDEAAIAE